MRTGISWVLLSIFAIAAPSLAGDQEDSFQKHAQDIEAKILAESLVARASGLELDQAMQCRMQEMFDPGRNYFTQADYQKLSQNKCSENFCLGKMLPFDETLKRAVERNDEMQAWLKAQKNVLVNIRSDGKIPLTASWDVWPKDDTELKDRWMKLLTFNVIKEMMRQNSTDQEIIQIQIVRAMVEAAETEKKEWLSQNVQQRRDLFASARITCEDRYARISKKQSKTLLDFIAPVPKGPINMGIHASINPKGQPFIEQLIPGTKASMDGLLQVDDQILSITVDGKKIGFKDPGFVAAWTAERPKGAKVSVEVKRGDEVINADVDYQETLSAESLVVGRDIPVNGKIIRVISIPNFIPHNKALSAEDTSTSAQVVRALARGGAHDAVVLDLRSNTGGLGNEGRRVASLFLSPEGSPVSAVVQKGDDGKLFTKVVKMKSDSPVTDVPLFIFTNRETGSASEIATDALKSANRAILIGDTTFGKGIEQTPVKLANGDHLIVTSVADLGLGEKPYHGVGITPHLRVPYLSGTDPDIKEKQPLSLLTQVERPIVTFSDDYLKVDLEALEATRAFAKQYAAPGQNAKSPAAHLNEYYKSNSWLTKLNAGNAFPLNIDDGADLDRERARHLNYVGQYGGSANSVDYSPRSNATDWSLLMAAKYLEEAKR